MSISTAKLQAQLPQTLSLNCALVGALSSGFWKPDAAMIRTGKEMQCATWPFPTTRGYQEYTFSLTKAEEKASYSQADSLSWYSKVTDRMVAVNEEAQVGSVARAHFKGLVLDRILNEEVHRQSRQSSALRICGLTFRL